MSDLSRHLIKSYPEFINPSTRLKLFSYRKPADNLFYPSKHYQEHQLSLQASTSGGVTPMPDFSLSTPAWDPSSRSPMPEFFTPPNSSPILVASTSQISNSLQASSHFFLNRRLIGITLKVVVNGGEYKDKELDAHLVEVNGQLCIRHVHYKSSISLQPDWITPKHPCPKRDKGLLIVIKGEHQGKLVRRIRHQNKDKQVIMILVVIHRKAGVADVLSDENLELSSEFLCVVSETKEEKRLGNALLTSLRQ